MIDFGHPKGVQSTVFVPLSLLTALFVIPLVARDLLQHFNLYWIHRYLGIAGTLLFIMSLIHVVRKCNATRTGKVKAFVLLHEFGSWLGVVMVLIHAGTQWHTTLPWLATVAMLVCVIMGLLGKVMRDRAQSIHAHRQQAARSKVTRHSRIDSRFPPVFKKWHQVHVPMSMAFSVLSLFHIASVCWFWNWQ